MLSPQYIYNLLNRKEIPRFLTAPRLLDLAKSPVSAVKNLLIISVIFN